GCFEAPFRPRVAELGGNGCCTCRERASIRSVALDRAKLREGRIFRDSVARLVRVQEGVATHLLTCLEGVVRACIDPNANSGEPVAALELEAPPKRGRAI